MRIGRGTYNGDVHHMHIMIKGRKWGLGLRHGSRKLNRDDLQPSSADIRTAGFPERIGLTAVDAYRTTIPDNETDVAYFLWSWGYLRFPCTISRSWRILASRSINILCGEYCLLFFWTPMLRWSTRTLWNVVNSFFQYPALSIIQPPVPYNPRFTSFVFWEDAYVTGLVVASELGRMVFR